MDHRIQAVVRQRPVHQNGQRIDPRCQKVREKRAHDVEREIEDSQHDAEKDGQRPDPVGDHPINPLASDALFGLAALYHRILAHPLNKVVPHVGQGRVAVHTALRLHLGDAVLDQFQLILIQFQPRRKVRVAFDQLRGGKSDGDAGGLGMVFDLMGHRVDAAVDGAGRTKILDGGKRPALSSLHRGLYKLPNALVLHGGDGHHRDAQRLGHARNVDGSAVFPHLVHHVQRQHHGNLRLHQLQSQIQIPLNVGRVHDVDDAVRPLVEDEVPCDNFLRCVGPDGVNARQIHHRAVLFPSDDAGFSVHRHTGKVAHVLIGAGELVKKRGLSTVLVSRQRKNHGRTSTSMFRASSFRRDRAYPRTCNSKGSPSGAILSIRTAVFGIRPISNRRQRSAPCPPTAVMTAS
ncbi:hypothetical protein SDC9_105106 [bioreactor metagenome]|uniref:Uncharacterized protein n=1 Tax=bioreactor metagenome TaxID=1076179 RepID=A0A645AYF4_9ZZZZ